MKLNTESTKLERLRILVGGLLAAAGIFAILIFGYTNAVVWLVGLSLVAAGLFLAGSTRLIEIFQGLISF